MKITKLHIDTFRHLENLDFDFTYPLDYKDKHKAGKPLDKICFIGQSATGKTGLLELIYDYNVNVLNLEVINGRHLTASKNNIKLVNGEVQFSINGNVFIQKKGEVIYKNRNYKYENTGGSVTDLISFEDKNDIFYFKSNLISDKNIDLFAKNPIDLIEKYSIELKHIEEEFRHKESFGVLFNDNVDEKIWLYLLNDILSYRKNFTQKMSELIHKGLLANPKKLSFEFEKWQQENPNKLEEFAIKFNPILEKLNLEVDIVDTEFSISIKNKRNEEVIPIQNTSTGTKGLLLSFLPLYKLDTEDSIILIDEPERSLYPDMQMELMDHYKSFAPKAQFIVATHSPFIAASFEPEERFILFFNKDGKVSVRKGESPIGDDPNDLLENDFGINYINKFGQKKHQQYLDLKQKIFFEKDESKKKTIAKELEKLGEEYNF